MLQLHLDKQRYCVQDYHVTFLCTLIKDYPTTLFCTHAEAPAFSRGRVYMSTMKGLGRQSVHKYNDRL